MNQELNPGEARTKARQRRQVTFLVVSGLIGGLIGFFVSFFDQGGGNLFSGDWEQLSLPPGIAIGLALALALALLALPLWAFGQIDDYKREQNLIGFAGGCMAVVAGFPIWAVLYAGGFVPPPHAFGIFAIAVVSMFAAFLYARWRL